MKSKMILTALAFAISSSVFADGFDYSKVNGNDPATYNALNQETTRLNTYTYGNSVAIQNLAGRANDTDLALIGQGQRNDQQDTRLNAHDAQFANQDVINEALSSQLNGFYTDTAGLRDGVRQATQEAHQARKEAREAKAGATAALAVAGQQFDIHGGLQTSVSVSTMGGYQGIAVGAGGAISDRVFINAAFTTSSSQTGGVVAGTYSW